jgi:hypothetical protein
VSGYRLLLIGNCWEIGARRAIFGAPLVSVRADVSCLIGRECVTTWHEPPEMYSIGCDYPVFRLLSDTAAWLRATSVPGVSRH